MKEQRYNSAILADRSFTVADGVRGLLETMFRSVVLVADVDSLLDSVGRLKPDLAVIDISLTGDGSLDWMRFLHERCPETRMIALSVHDEAGAREAVLKSGCDDVVLKRNIGSDLLDTVERVMNGSEPEACT